MLLVSSNRIEIEVNRKKMLLVGFKRKEKKSNTSLYGVHLVLRLFFSRNTQKDKLS